MSRDDPVALLSLPAPADNAAMQTDPSEAAPPKRERRWFQFSLRTLLIVVTLLAVACGYVCRQVEIVAARKAWLESHPWDLANPDETGPGRLMPLPVRYAGDNTHFM